MIIHVTIKGQEIKLTRKEYLRKYAVNQQKNPYNDKMMRTDIKYDRKPGKYHYKNNDHTRNYNK